MAFVFAARLPSGEGKTSTVLLRRGQQGRTRKLKLTRSTRQKLKPNATTKLAYLIGAKLSRIHIDLFEVAFRM